MTPTERERLIADTKRETINRIRIRFDSIINAHLWGDYGFNAREIWGQANAYLDKLEELERSLT